MRWPAPWPKEPTTADEIRSDKRTVRRLALLPTKVDLDEDPPMVVWLEWYWCYQEWDSSAYDPCWRTLGKYSGQPELDTA